MPDAENHGVRIHYEVEGRGFPLVLLHGTTGSVLSWRDAGHMDALATGRQVIAVDLRGHGASDKPLEVEVYDWGILVADIVAVLDSCSIEAADIVGYSAGSYVALGFGMTTQRRTRSLILGGASTSWAGAGDTTRALLSEGMAAFVRAFFESKRPLPTPEREKLLANDAAAILASLDATRCCPTSEMLEGFLPPCLIFVGEEDPRLADSREMVSHLPNATLVSLPKLNHLQAFARCDLVIPHLLAFLEKIEP